MPDLAPRPMWCDTFDCDLPKVIPAASRLFDKIGEQRLYTHCIASRGAINCPAAWNTGIGLASFFGLRAGGPAKPETFWTSAPVVECTVWEAVRDLWAHHHALIILRHDGDFGVCWKPPYRAFETILWDVRGWRADAARRAAAEREALAGLARAAILIEQELADA